jgi:hypothetical protein
VAAEKINNLRFAGIAAIAAIAWVAATSGCASHPPSADPGIVTIGESDPAAVALASAAARRVEGIRGLQFKSDVKKAFLSRSELQAYFDAEAAEQSDPVAERGAQVAAELFGFVSRGQSVRESSRQLANEQVAGFYDPKRKQLFLIRGGDESSESVMAHELCHALDDQYYDLNGYDEKLKSLEPENSDRAFAWNAVCEGSAMVVSVHYELSGENLSLAGIADLMRGVQSEEPAAGEPAGAMDGETADLDAGDVDEILAMTEGEETIDLVPDIVSRPMIQQYFTGANFLNRGRGFFGRPSTEDLARAFSDPPRSSEQLFHPEKYWDPARRDDPKIVHITNITAVLGKDWKYLSSDVLGEMGVSILTADPDDAPATFDERVAHWLGPGCTTLESEGWGGDRLDVYESRTGAALVVWASVWDTELDAKQMAMGVPERPGIERCVERRGDRCVFAIGRGVPKAVLQDVVKTVFSGFEVTVSAPVDGR